MIRMKALWAVLLLAQFSTTRCDLQETMNLLLRQVRSMQTYIDEKARADSASGLLQLRNTFGGTKHYFFDGHTGRAAASIHNHANNFNTMGMGEIAAILNGVYFRTRHNDYKLIMPHRTAKGYRDNEPIPFPAVPPSVSQRTSVAAQITELRQYFKAFKDQNPSLRNYKPYFKPVLCYLEGAWFSSTGSFEESFDSDRHFLDADSWLELQEKVNFFAYTGAKNQDENLAYLPTQINEVLPNNSVIMAQWNYRIRCAPVSLDSDNGLNTNRLRGIDDLPARLSNRKTFAEHLKTRAARFQLGDWPPGKTGRQLERRKRDTVLDKLMNQIPGFDNYPANIPDDDFGVAANALNGSVLNSGYYHNTYKQAKKDAMGSSNRRRGFSDPNVYMAQNTQANVPGQRYEGCTKNKGRRGKTCRDLRQKWSWAIPLEIIYLTPLLSWNPYNLEYREKPTEKLVNQGGRNGGLTTDKAYNGNAKRFYFRTPKGFFEDDTDTDAADTGRDVVGVLDRTGAVKQVRSSGTRIFLPNIPGVGEIRLRYPIAPSANDGNNIFKSVEALQDVALQMSSYADMLLEMPPGSGAAAPPPPPAVDIDLQMDETHKMPPGQHTHSFTLTPEDVKKLMNLQVVTVETSEELGHSHSLRLQMNRNRRRLRVIRCDSTRVCWDGHPLVISAANAMLRKTGK